LYAAAPAVRASRQAWDADLDAVGHGLGLGRLGHQFGLDLDRDSKRANSGQAKRLTILTPADADECRQP